MLLYQLRLLPPGLGGRGKEREAALRLRHASQLLAAALSWGQAVPIRRLREDPF